MALYLLDRIVIQIRKDSAITCCRPHFFINAGNNDMIFVGQKGCLVNKNINTSYLSGMVFLYKNLLQNDPLSIK